jgi:hypothetical protein
MRQIDLGGKRRIKTEKQNKIANDFKDVTIEIQLFLFFLVILRLAQFILH